MNIIGVKHNIEVAHRLFESPGKCENIHGHSMWVTLKLQGVIDQHGLLDGLDFGEVKRYFRNALDTELDHRLILNVADPYARQIATVDESGANNWGTLPGLQLWDGDPTTESLARRIGTQMGVQFSRVHSVTVWETAVNCAEWIK